MTTCSICPGSALTCPISPPQSEAQLDVLADQPAQHGFHAGEQLVEIQQPRLQHLPAAVRQQLACEPAARSPAFMICSTALWFGSVAGSAFSRIWL
jgi:hypothetical protein